MARRAHSSKRAIRPSAAPVRHREPGDDDWVAPRVTQWEHDGEGDHRRSVAAFVAAVRGERPVACTGEDGRAAMRLALASYESAAAGVPVATAD